MKKSNSISRRNFIEKAAVTVGLSALSFEMVFEKSKSPTMMKKIGLPSKAFRPMCA